MLYTYGISQPGTYHIKNGIVCQDSHHIIRAGKESAIAAVADGLGSAEHSDVGSQIAVSVSTEYCRRHITANTNAGQLLDIMRAAFTAALRAIEKEAAAKDRAQDLYDTTLTLVILIRDTLFYGHSGDSGIIALTTQGRYKQVTTQQRDQYGRVFPLFFEEKWEFDKFESKVSSVLLATDGMLETFFPIYIKDSPDNIHVSLAQFFMDPQSLRISKLGQSAITIQMAEFLEKIPDEQVNDDKTVVVLVNPSIKTKQQPEEYYREPDWAELKKKHDEKWKREAYPGLYKDNQADTKQATVSAEVTGGDTAEPKQDKGTAKPAQTMQRPAARFKPNKSVVPLTLLVALLAVGLIVIVNVRFLDIKGAPETITESETETTVASEPETTTESEPEAMAESEPEITLASELETAAVPEPKTTAESEPEMTSAPEPETTVSPVPESASARDQAASAAPDPEAAASLTHERISTPTSLPDSIPRPD